MAVYLGQTSFASAKIRIGANAVDNIFLGSNSILQQNIENSLILTQSFDPNINITASNFNMVESAVFGFDVELQVGRGIIFEVGGTGTGVIIAIADDGTFLARHTTGNLAITDPSVAKIIVEAGSLPAGTSNVLYEIRRPQIQSRSRLFINNILVAEENTAVNTESWSGSNGGGTFKKNDSTANTSPYIVRSPYVGNTSTIRYYQNQLVPA